MKSARGMVRNGAILAAAALRRVGGRSGGGRVLAFHEVGDLARFRDRLDWLMSRYEVVSVRDMLASSAGNRSKVALTFDDGFSFWHEELAPLLRDRGVPAVFFVCSGLIGLSGQSADRFARRNLKRARQLRFLTLQQLRDLADDPLFEIGGHTVNHPHLGRLGDEPALRREIADDRSRLQEWTGSGVDLFAYPFGTPDAITPAARRAVAQLGYAAAFTLIPGPWAHRGADRYTIGRDGLQLDYSDAQWNARLAGGYDWLYRAKVALTPRSVAARGEGAS